MSRDTRPVIGEGDCGEERVVIFFDRSDICVKRLMTTFSSVYRSEMFLRIIYSNYMYRAFLFLLVEKFLIPLTSICHVLYMNPNLDELCF